MNETGGTPKILFDGWMMLGERLKCSLMDEWCWGTPKMLYDGWMTLGNALYIGGVGIGKKEQWRKKCCWLSNTFVNKHYSNYNLLVVVAHVCQESHFTLYRVAWAMRGGIRSCHTNPHLPRAALQLLNKLSVEKSKRTYKDNQPYH